MFVWKVEQSGQLIETALLFLFLHHHHHQQLYTHINKPGIAVRTAHWPQTQLQHVSSAHQIVKMLLFVLWN